MANTKKKYPVPKFSSLEEEDKYWQSHSPLDEGYEGRVQRKQQNRASFLSIRLTGEELARLREIATGHGLGPSTYARLIIVQGMESGIDSLTPSLLMSLCNQVCKLTGEPQEEYMQKLNEIYGEFLKIQESVAAQIANLCVPNIFPIIQDQKEKARR